MKSNVNFSEDELAALKATRRYARLARKVVNFLRYTRRYARGAK